MGFSIFWLAIKTDDVGSLYPQLNLETTGQKSFFYDGRVTSKTLSSGWHLIVFRGVDHKAINDSSLADISSQYECIAASIEEHVMFSMATSWKDGQEVWRITHDQDSHDGDVRHLEIKGTPPTHFENIRDNLAKKQDKEDEGGDADDAVDFFFDIPLATAQEIIGFKHDIDHEDTSTDDFSVLKFTNEKPWWKFW